MSARTPIQGAALEDQPGFRFVDEGENYVTVQHPDGRQMAIPTDKKYVSKDMLEQIRGLPRLEDKVAPSATSTTVSAEPMNPVDVALNAGSYQTTPQGTPRFAPKASPFGAVGPSTVGAPMLDVQPQGQAWTPAVPQAVEGAPAPAPEQAPAAAVPSLDTAGKLGSAYDRQAAAIRENAAAQAEAARQQAAMQDAYMAQMKEQAEKYAKSRADIETRMESARKDVESGKVDPNRWWSQQTGGAGVAKRVSALLGMILGGVAQMKTGVNPAAAAMQKLIDDDIASQKEQMDRKQNMLKTYFDQMGDLRQAETATRLDMVNMLNAQVAKIAAQTQNATVQANAKIALAQLDIERQKGADSLAMQQVSGLLVGGIDSAVGDQLVAQLPPEKQKQVVKVFDKQNPKGRWMMARSDADAADVGDIQKVVDGLHMTIQKMRSVQKESGRELFWFSDPKEDAKTLQTQALEQLTFLRRVMGGRAQPLTESSIKTLERMVPNVTQLDQGEVTDRVNRLEQYVSDLKNQAYSNKLIGYSPTTVRFEED